MKRRRFLRGSAAGGLAAAGVLSAPRIGHAADNKVLRFVPRQNLANFDPIWTTLLVVRNGALLIWDTLYGVDDRLQPQPQMVEAHEVDATYKTWTFRLRPGLRFHDNEPVRANDVVASIRRWMARDAMGGRIKRQLDAVEVVDDRTFRFRLNAPFPKLLYALGKGCQPALFIMPERIAATDPFKQISEHIGSGPMRFKKDEFVTGSLAVFERFVGYEPRSEPNNWMAGGKHIHFDRIEWKIMPDAATASAALQNGEVDWWELANADLVPLLGKTPGVAVDFNNPLGRLGTLHVNHLHAPFNDVRARRALQVALNQTDYMAAGLGEDTTAWQISASFFTPGTALYSDQGGEALKGPRRIEEAKKLLAEAGYRNEPIVLMGVNDDPIYKAWSDLTADLLKQIGMTVQYDVMDFGTLAQRRAKKDKPSEGGWHLFHTTHPGDTCANPAAYTELEATGDKAWFGWPQSDAVQNKFADWYAAVDLAGEQKAVAELNQAAMDHVTYIPLGFFRDRQAWRKTLSGITPAPFPVFWGVTKG